MRSVADLQGIEDSASLSWPCRREGDVRLVEFEAVNDTILVDAQTKRVSIPSGVEAGAGKGDLFAMRAGRVKERRTVACET